MENNDILDQSGAYDMHLSEAAKSYLSETAKWAKFLAIVGFIGIGLLVLVGLFAGSIMAMTGSQEDLLMPIDGAALGAIYVVLALMYVMPVLYLYRFAERTKRGILFSDSTALTDGLSQLKSCFKFIGVFTIVILSIYVLIFVGSMLFIGTM